MGFIGKLLAVPIKIANIPVRAIEKLVDSDSQYGEEGNPSSILKTISDACEEIDE